MDLFSFLRTWSDLLKKSVMETSFLCSGMSMPLDKYVFKVINKNIGIYLTYYDVLNVLKVNNKNTRTRWNDVFLVCLLLIWRY